MARSNSTLMSIQVRTAPSLRVYRWRTEIEYLLNHIGQRTTRTPSTIYHFPRSSLQLVIGALIFVAVTDMAFVAYVGYIFSTVYFDDTNLPLANPYIGLEDLYRQGRVQSPSLQPLLNQAHIAVQVFRNEPHRSASRGVRQVWQEGLGGISTIDRHLLVNDEVRSRIPDVASSSTAQVSC